MDNQAEAQEAKKPRPLLTALKTAVGFALIVVLIRSVIGDQWPAFGPALRSSIGSWLLVAFLLHASATFFCMLRWRMLLAVQGIHVSFVLVARLTLIGLSYSLVIPGGAVSGDLVKMWYVSPHAAGKRAEALLTIGLDRVIGLMGLFVVASISVVVSLPILAQAPPQIRVATYILGVGSLCGVIGVLAVQFHEVLERIRGVGALIDWGRRRLPGRLTDIVGRMVRAMDLYRENKVVIFKAMLLSMMVHTVLTGCLFALGQGFHETAVGLREYFVTTQVGNLAGGVPLTAGGIGTRDFVINRFLQSFGAAESTAAIVTLAYTAVIVVLGVLGFMVFIFSGRGRKKESKESSG